MFSNYLNKQIAGDRTEYARTGWEQVRVSQEWGGDG